jgi:MFS family permease
MFGVAVGWQVYEITRNPLYLGYIGLAQFLPFFILALVGGHVADRCRRRNILFVCALVQALGAVALFFLAKGRVTSVHAFFGVLALLGAARAFSAPAGQAITPTLVPIQHFSNAVAWNSSMFQIGTIVGPALGGSIYGWVGPRAVYLVSATGSILAAILVGAIRAEGEKLNVEGLSLDTFFAGIRYVWTRRILLGSISMDLFAVLFGGAVALLPVYARDILGTGPWGLGILRSAPAIGASAMAAILAHRPLRSRVGKKMFGAVAIFGLATIVFGVSRNLALSVMALVVLGAADMVSVVIRLTLEQIATPPEMRGRVGAVNMMFIGASNQLGEFESGITAALFGTVPSVVLGGLAACVIVAIWAWMFPELRRVQTLDTKDQEVGIGSGIS